MCEVFSHHWDRTKTFLFLISKRTLRVFGHRHKKMAAHIFRWCGQRRCGLHIDAAFQRDGDMNVVLSTLPFRLLHECRNTMQPSEQITNRRLLHWIFYHRERAQLLFVCSSLATAPSPSLDHYTKFRLRSIVDHDGAALNNAACDNKNNIFNFVEYSVINNNILNKLLNSQLIEKYLFCQNVE